MANLIVSAVAEWNGRALTQGQKQIGSFEKNVKNLGKTLGLTFGTAAVIAYGKASVQAAAADQKAQQQLALALRNVGLGRDAATSEAYIQRLQTEFGVIDDKLRPAYQTLAVATQNTAQAQKLFQLSLDISASTGRDLASVSAALSKGFLGNTAALSKLGVGISKADLKTKSFEKITDQLATTFAGSATAAANTFQGSMDKLAVSSANVQEIIGTGLIDALKGLGDEDSVDNLAKNMESAALYTADVIRGIGVLGEKLKGIPGFSLLSVQMIPIVGSYIEALRNAGKVAAELDYTAASSATAFEKGFGAYAKIVSKAKVLTAEENKQLKARQLKAALDKANLALGKGSDVFDIEKIQLQAAEINQAKQLGNITSQAQALQITNDLARLRVKQSILALDEAIASGDVKAITSATARLNADLGILGNLNNQALKLADIKSILASIAPKDLINIKNLEQALALLGQITGKTVGSAGSIASMNTPNHVIGTGITKDTVLTQPQLDYYNQMQKEFAYGDEGMYFPTPQSVLDSALGRAPNINITVQAGVGDPNAIAEAIDQLLIDAVQRGTLRPTL